MSNRFSKELDIIPSNINISEIDYDLIERIVIIIEDNIDNSELNGDMLLYKMAISKVKFYKKIKALA